MGDINVRGKSGKVSKEYAISTEELDKLINNTKGKSQTLRRHAQSQQSCGA